MSIEAKNEDGTKKRVVLYFNPDNGDVAKDFAGRMRITDHVECTLVWSTQFKSERDVRVGVGAAVLQEGCPNSDLIRQMYAQASPDTEIHYMTKEGQWVENEDESVEAADAGDKEPDQPGVPDVQAEAETPAADIIPDSAEEPGRRIGEPSGDGDAPESADVSADDEGVESEGTDATGDAEDQPEG